MSSYEPDEEEFLYDGQHLTVLRGQHPGNFYCAHAFFLAQRFASQPDSSILKDEQGYPMTGFVHTPRGEEHKHEQLVAQIEWVLTRVLRGLLFRALRMTKDPIRIAVTGFGPFEDQQGDAVPHNVTGEFVSAPSRLRGALFGALPDLNAPKQPGLEVPEPLSPDDTVIAHQVYDPSYRLGRPVLLMGRVLPVDTHALSDDPQVSLTGLLQAFRPHIWVGLGVRKRGMPEFVIEEVSDDSGLTLLPAPRHSGDHQPTTGHPLNRAAARAFAQGVLELGGYSHDA